MEEKQESQIQPKQKARKRPVRAEFPFPIYPLSAALEIARKVETEYAGSLTEATLAIALAASAKSSGFQLKVLTAKQFGLLIKQGDNLMTTKLAKSIFKPISDDERSAALAEAFHNIPLFGAVSNKYQGSPLPPDEALRNVLEREFKVTRERVVSAHSMLINSAKTAEVLQESQGNVYLLRKPVIKPLAPPTEKATEIPTGTRGVTININIQLQLPATEDATIYDSLFSALKRHLFP